jgi:hypothetical protein
MISDFNEIESFIVDMKIEINKQNLIEIKSKKIIFSWCKNK